MAPENDPLRIAVAQASPVFLDKDATVEKACRLIGDAADGGAALVVFPESFIPGYPDWVWVVPNSRKAIIDALYTEFLANAVTVPDASTRRICVAHGCNPRPLRVQGHVSGARMDERGQQLRD